MAVSLPRAGGDTAVPTAAGHGYGHGTKEPAPKADQLPGKEQLRAPGISLLMSWFPANPRNDSAGAGPPHWAAHTWFILIYLKAKPNLTIQFLGFSPLVETGEENLPLGF